MRRRVHEPHRPAVAHRVEIGGHQVPAFGQFALVPAPAQDPAALALALGHVSGALGDKLDGVADALHLRVAQVDLGQFDQPADREMRVRIDEPRRHGATGKIDSRSSGAGQRLDVVVRAHRKDLPVAYGHRLGDRISGVDRQDVAVHQDAVGGWTLGRQWPAALQPMSVQSSNSVQRMPKKGSEYIFKQKAQTPLAKNVL